jgi:hypothetical protein
MHQKGKGEVMLGKVAPLVSLMLRILWLPQLKGALVKKGKSLGSILNLQNQ